MISVIKVEEYLDFLIFLIEIFQHALILLFCLTLLNYWFTAGKYHEQINIEENATGYSYEKLFYRFISNEVLDYVEINDPYIKSKHQVRILYVLFLLGFFYKRH